ncbi:MAG: hypothetical protein P1V13_22150 [Rhizobiaceae bacterium]|nr:hypothetical protein [Rhizobiaceae bacterium]
MNGLIGLVEEHRRLGRQAREHKRAANRHRQAAIAAREQQTAIEARCKALGIAVTIHMHSGEGELHGRSKNDRNKTRASA